MTPPEAPTLVLGVDVGGTKILAVLVDPDRPRVVIDRARTRTPTEPAALLDVIGGLVSSLAAEQQLGAIGIGAAGLVDRSGRFLVGPNLPAAVGIDFAEALVERSGVPEVPVVVDNDATVATLAELRLGAAQGRRDVVLVTLGTGIGGGVVSEGVLVRGAHGFAGEFGHLLVEPGGRRCACGRGGCWETRASGTALAASTLAAAAAGDLAELVAARGGDPAAVSAEDLTEAAAAGDAAAVAVLEAFAHWVAVGVVNLVAVLDPEVVVVSGGLVDVGEVLLGPVRQATAELLFGGAARTRIQILPATLGSDAVAVGAALLAAESAGNVLRGSEAPPLP